MSAKSRREQIEAMLAEEPNDAELRYMLAMEHASAGDDAGAARVFQELIQVVPNFPPAYHMLGRTLQRLGRNAEARAILQQGIPIAQKQGNLHAAGEMSELLESIEQGRLRFRVVTALHARETASAPEKIKHQLVAAVLAW